MIRHNRKISGPVTAGDWNDDPHMVDRKALLKFLGISSGGGGSGHWVLLDDLEFLSPVHSFTLYPDGYDFLRIEYAVIVTYSSGSNPHFAIYPNGDTATGNYSNYMHYTDSSGGHQRLSNWKFPYPLFARAESLNVQCMNIGNILISLKNGIRRLFVNENNIIGGGYFFRAEHIAQWKNTSSNVNSLNILSQDGVLTGKVAVYGW